MKSIRDSKQLYWGLIITFFVLYFCVGFVSTLHSITFFELANSLWMAVLLGITYEVGQASVLFSILMTKNAQKLLPWLLMFLLTALQVTANVYASFKFMDMSGSTDWTFWQRSILFWMETDSPEMFKVVISWITGALLPIVALGMTALVAENLKLKDEEEKAKEEEFDDPGPEPDDLSPTEDYIQEQIDKATPEDFEDISEHINDTIQEDLRKIKEQEADPSGIEPVVVPPREEQLGAFAEEILDPKNHLKFPPDAKIPEAGEIKKPIEVPLQPTDNVINPDDWKKLDGEPPVKPIIPVFAAPKFDLGPTTIKAEPDEDETTTGNFDKDPATGEFEKKPISNPRGWHLKKEYIDENGDVYNFGKFIPEEKPEPPKKAQG